MQCEKKIHTFAPTRERERERRWETEKASCSQAKCRVSWITLACDCEPSVSDEDDLFTNQQQLMTILKIVGLYIGFSGHVTFGRVCWQCPTRNFKYAADGKACERRLLLTVLINSRYTFIVAKTIAASYNQLHQQDIVPVSSWRLCKMSHIHIFGSSSKTR